MSEGLRILARIIAREEVKKRLAEKSGVNRHPHPSTFEPERTGCEKDSKRLSEKHQQGGCWGALFLAKKEMV